MELFNFAFFCLSSEMHLLLMPKNSGNIPIVQWPLFLLASKVRVRCPFTSFFFFFFKVVLFPIALNSCLLAFCILYP